MLSDKRIKEAESNVRRYLAESLLKKHKNETAKEMYIENSDLSLETAQKLLSLETSTYRPYLWIIVSSYYAMYYVANAVLLNIGYKVGDKISHKVTCDALIIFARDKRSKFQYQMDEQVKKSKALTSIERAKEFVFELKKLL